MYSLYILVDNNLKLLLPTDTQYYRPVGYCRFLILFKSIYKRIIIFIEIVDFKFINFNVNIIVELHKYTEA